MSADKPVFTPSSGGESEGDLIAWLRQQPWLQQPDLLGDDSALTSWRGSLALTVDQQIEGIHFPTALDPSVVARRLLRVCLSDLAAVGAEPRLGLLTLSGPPNLDRRQFFRGFLGDCRRFRLQLAGGDLAAAPILISSLTLLGRRPRRGNWAERGSAEVGDRIWLSGSVGISRIGRELLAAGARWMDDGVKLPPGLRFAGPVAHLAHQAVLTHLLPEPQLKLGAWLAGRKRAAAIDLSDGLTLDLARLCAASEVGAALDRVALAPDDPMQQLAERLELDPWQVRLAGGEDYALLFCLPARVEPPSRFRAEQIGRIIAEEGIYLGTGPDREPLRPAGWDHLSGSSQED